MNIRIEGGPHNGLRLALEECGDWLALDFSGWRHHYRRSEPDVAPGEGVTLADVAYRHDSARTEPLAGPEPERPCDARARLRGVALEPWPPEGHSHPGDVPGGRLNREES